MRTLRYWGRRPAVIGRTQRALHLLILKRGIGHDIYRADASMCLPMDGGRFSPFALRSASEFLNGPMTPSEGHLPRKAYDAFAYT